MLVCFFFSKSFSQTWTNIGNSYVCGSGVNQLVSFNSRVYANGVPQITDWNYATWQNFANVITPEKIWCVTVFQNEIYVCGEFTSIGGIAASNIAKFNSTSWSTVGAGLSGGCSNLAVYNNELYAFGIYGDTIYNNGSIAKWNGVSWSSLPGSNYFYGYVSDNINFQNELIVVGSFSSIGGTSAYNIAKYNGTSWSTVGGGTNYITNILTVNNNDLYVGGYFTMVGGNIPASCIAKWNGSSWSAVGNGLGGTDHAGGLPAVHGLAFYDNNLYAGGQFNVVGTGTGSDLAAWDGNDWHNVGTYGGGSCGGVYALGVFDEDLWVAGLFDTAGNISANNIARLTIYTGMNQSMLDNSRCTIYPNPSSEKILISNLPPDRQAEIKIFNSTGELQSTTFITYSQHQTEINISNLAEGIHFLRTNTSEGILTRKFIVSRN